MQGVLFGESITFRDRTFSSLNRSEHGACSRRAFLLSWEPKTKNKTTFETRAFLEIVLVVDQVL
jgi:hypothetical protein